MVRERSNPRVGDASCSRRAALVLLALFLVARVAEFAHYVVEPHGVCAVHGELVHGTCAHDSGAQTAEHRHDAPIDSHPQLVELDGHHEHGEHCTLSRFLKRDATTPGASRASVAVHAAVAVRALPEDRPRAPRIEIHLLAPKQSPPLHRAA